MDYALARHGWSQVGDTVEDASTSDADSVVPANADNQRHFLLCPDAVCGLERRCAPGSPICCSPCFVPARQQLSGAILSRKCRTRVALTFSHSLLTLQVGCEFYYHYFRGENVLWVALGRQNRAIFDVSMFCGCFLVVLCCRGERWGEIFC